MDSDVSERARHEAVAVIDLSALRANYRILAKASAPAESAAVVKGDGYGLGMLVAAGIAFEAGARTFFVARLTDGEELREALPGARIAVLDGLAGLAPKRFAKAGLTPVLGSVDEVRAWQASESMEPWFLHIDTAMNRLGVRRQDLAALHDIGAAPAVYLTHLASADDGDRALCKAQIKRFNAALARLPPAPVSISNSAGLFLDPAIRQDLTRPGKAFYGINPARPRSPAPVTQALAVYAPILQVADIAAGDTVGYSATFTAKAAMRVATLGIGYANGYQRALSNKGVVAFGGYRAPVIGRVSMDLVTADVTGLPAKALDPGYAEMLGPTIGLTELATLAGTNEYELQIALGRGCPRVYVNPLTRA